MGEIRSTMDIIMEKTRGLTMTEDEKKAVKVQEITGKIRGIIQRFLDGALGPQRLDVEVAALKEKDRDMVEGIIIEEALSRIQVGEDNESILKILGGATKLDTAPIRRVLGDFEQRIQREKAAREKAVKERLKEGGITGSAVIANIKADPGWLQYVSGLKEEFQEKLRTCAMGLHD